MTKEQTKEAIRVMQAWLDDKEIECRTKGSANWLPFEHNEMFCFNFQSFYYRIKPELHYRPFKTAEEMMEAIKEHGDWVARKDEGRIKLRLCRIEDKGVYYTEEMAIISMREALSSLTFADGTPFGKLEE